MASGIVPLTAFIYLCSSPAMPRQQIVHSPRDTSVETREIFTNENFERSLSPVEEGNLIINEGYSLSPKPTIPILKITLKDTQFTGRQPKNGKIYMLRVPWMPRTIFRLGSVTLYKESHFLCILLRPNTDTSLYYFCDSMNLELQEVNLENVDKH
uniref:Uncharacterized protein n=1 Tax=Romanomermis culicivorax TaxID=13658 RepID=A0A915I6U5_ROMCU